MKKAILFDTLQNKKVRCNICGHRCLILQDRRGFCGVRVNKGGILYSLAYGKVLSYNANPIEMKPLFHYQPGSLCFSLGTAGCNFRCPGCQNWELSHRKIEDTTAVCTDISPEDSVKMSFKNECQGISWTFNEPTVWFEYTLDGAKKAKRQGLYTVYVSNGYISPEALEMISPYLDAFRVDLKGFSEDTYKKISGVKAFAGVLNSMKIARKKYKMHVECVTNIISGMNDNERELNEMADWIKRELGPETPWHVTRFYPSFKLQNIPCTPLVKLERIRTIGLQAGLRYVYLGNVTGHPWENTYCYQCDALLIERRGFTISQFNIREGKCPKCNIDIYGVFSLPKYPC